ncbi:UNVERIFIED_CONTAM: hypothetical protein K2H54_017524 [Gekko kuhli]
MSGADGDRSTTPPVTTDITPVMDVCAGDYGTTGQLTQWGQFHPGLMTETYLLTEGLRRDNQWDPVGVPVSRTLQGGATADMSSVWREPLQGEGNQTPPEEEVSVGRDDRGDEEDPWTARLMNLERGQYKIQRDLEEMILTIPEIVIHALNAERVAGRPDREPQCPPPRDRFQLDHRHLGAREKEALEIPHLNDPRIS